MDAAVITALGVIITGAGGLILKMWRDHTAIAQRVINAVEQNAVANTKLQGSVDNFSKLLIRLVEQPKRR